MTPRLKELYAKQIRLELKEKFSFKNLYMAPQLKKIVLNMGLGLDGNDNKILKSCEEDLAKITLESRGVVDLPYYIFPHQTEQLSSKELKPYVKDFMEICISKYIFV